MSVYDNIRDGKYTNNVPWDIEPVPIDEERMTVKQAREHQEEQKRLKATFAGRSRRGGCG